ncbi:MAG: hypothetical protein Q8N86_04540 [Atribacterota bacterium]|nr:hypothetical protein [Atribacterota bacterium]
MERSNFDYPTCKAIIDSSIIKRAAKEAIRVLTDLPYRKKIVV